MILSIKTLAAGLLIAATQIDPTPVDPERAEMHFREAKDCATVTTGAYGASRCVDLWSSPMRGPEFSAGT